MNHYDRRLIEDFLPVEQLSELSSGEPRTKGHLSMVHLWRARRPLAACRAAIYASFVPAPVSDTERAEQRDFLSALCGWDVTLATLEQARTRILNEHGSVPRVLDLFAGGGSIPLEALRLGCEAHAIDVNPVAFLIEKATLEYPQRFGKSLADDLETWANRIIETVKAAAADVYPEIQMPSHLVNLKGSKKHLIDDKNNPDGTHLVPSAFLWTRTAECPNPQCRATVPLFGQTWLRRKPSRYVALRPKPEPDKRRVMFDIVESSTEKGLGFDPSQGMSGTSTKCLCCQTTLPADYVRRFGEETGYGQQLLCVIAVNPYDSGKLFLLDDSWVDAESGRQKLADERALKLENDLKISTLDEIIPPTGNAGLATGKSYLYGIKNFRQMYTPRQRYVMLEFVRAVREAHDQMIKSGMDTDRVQAITVFLALWVSRMTDRINSLTRWNNARETVESFTSMKRIAMTWDFPEVNPFGGGSGDSRNALTYLTAYIKRECESGAPASITRCSATKLPEEKFPDASFDAVVTDPPYYDNESYSELSDCFYIWLKPMLEDLFPEHLAGTLTPKRQECVAAAYRQGGKEAAKTFFEENLTAALAEGRRVLKPDGILVLVYAHKTTQGWTTLIEALRTSGFEVREAWPIETETKSRAAHQGDAALASSIFLTARPRQNTGTGQYETDVLPLLKEIITERVESLWLQGIGGANLLLASLGAGLRPYTQFPRVEHANGEPVPAEFFLQEVEGVVLDTILDSIFGLSKTGGASIDRLTRFYMLWRFTYREADIDAGDAIVFCYPQGVELDGPNGLAGPLPALVEKSGSSYRVRTFKDRGAEDNLGMLEDGSPAPVIDVLHRLLWLMENRPAGIPRFLKESKPSLEQLRRVAQVLCGPVFRRSDTPDASLTAELSALSKFTANWRSVVEGAGVDVETEARKTGQQQLGLNE